MSIFLLGDFKLRSGRSTDFKVDCDGLTDEDVACCAKLLARRVGKFGSVEGVPRGGLRLAAEMSKLATPPGPLLLVDDVLTTGAALVELRAGRPSLGAVVFARAKPPQWVKALFLLTEE